jgi:hypothetical protein
MEHMFSIEMKSKKFVKSISVSDDPRNRVYFEGFLGDIEELGFVNGGMLEIKGLNGTFRIDLSKEELRTICARNRRE